MTTIRNRARGLAGNVLPVLLAMILPGCSGGGTGSPAPAAPAAAAQQAPSSSAQAGAPPPLVDSRGNPAPSGGGAAGAPGESGAAARELAWTAPSEWVPVTPSSTMRKAQYSLPAAAGDKEGGECAVFYFGPGQGGDVQSNIDRWASQLTTEAGAHATPQQVATQVAGMKVLKVSMEGTYAPSPMMGGDTTPKPGTLLLGAIVEGSDANWFFKCTGPRKTMQSHRKEFDALIDSVHAK
jgi:hypothetical protein